MDIGMVGSSNEMLVLSIETKDKRQKTKDKRQKTKDKDKRCETKDERC